MSKSTYLIYGIPLELGADYSSIVGTERSTWDDDLLPYIEGHDGVACLLLRGEEPVKKAYFGLVMASTHNSYEASETDLTGFWTAKNRHQIDRALEEMRWLLGRDEAHPRLMMVDIIS